MPAIEAVTTFFSPDALTSGSSARLAAEFSVLIVNSFGVSLDATGTCLWRTCVMCTTNHRFQRVWSPLLQLNDKKCRTHLHKCTFRRCWRQAVQLGCSVARVGSGEDSAEKASRSCASSCPISVRKPSWPIGASITWTSTSPGQCVRQFPGLRREVKPVCVYGRNKEVGGGPRQSLPQRSAPAADVVAHERFGDCDVAVGIEAPHELAALVVQVAFHLVPAAASQGSACSGASLAWAFRPNRKSSSCADR